jgi:aspartyl/glutamyl-tRNA(Asn/Gln) amidotransferase C subunit
MNNFTSELVDDLAKKLLIGLSKEENQMVLDEFAIIDENLQKVEQIENISSVAAMTHCLDDFTFELRSDVAGSSVPIEDLLRNSGGVEDREIEVPKVVG